MNKPYIPHLNGAADIINAFRGTCRVLEAQERRSKAGLYSRVVLQYHKHRVCVTRRHDGVLFVNAGRVALMSKSLSKIRTEVYRACSV